MRRLAPLALAASLALGNLAFTNADVDDAVITDPAGDANGLNGQGFLIGVGDNPGGPNASWADLTHFRTVPGNIESELRLGVSNLSPDAPVIFRMMTEVAGCTTWFQVQNYDALVGTIRFTSDCGDVLTGTYSDGVTVELDEETSEYVFKIKFSALPAELKTLIKPGASADTIELSSRTFIGSGGTGATIPQLDDAIDDEASFKI